MKQPPRPRSYAFAVVLLMLASLIAGAAAVEYYGAPTITTTYTYTRTVTILQSVPGIVRLSGHIASSGTPTEIDFSAKSASGTVTVPAPIHAGNYSVSLTNRAAYNVTVVYSTWPFGSGSCFAGTLVLFQMTDNASLSWRC